MTVRECERYYRSRGKSQKEIEGAIFWGIIFSLVLPPKEAYHE